MINIKPDSAKTVKGTLEIGDISVVDLKKEYGTPLYIVDTKTIKDIAKEYLSIKQYYPNSRIAYAGKALSITALYQILEREGLYFDVVSDGELHTMLHAGVAGERAYFHGNNKTEAEMEYALKQKIGRIVVDNIDELKRWVSQHQKLKSQHSLDILVRIIPEISAHTHEFIKTGQRDTKFGVPMEHLQEFIREAKQYSFVNFKGLHAHIGSQIFDTDPMSMIVERLVELAAQLNQATGVLISELNIGGGIGIKYTEEDDPPSVSQFVKKIALKLKECLKKYAYPLEPLLVLEPGRSIVANAGVTLYTVGSVKEIPGTRTYVSVDGGMADNVRPITYGAKYSLDCANKMDALKNKIYTIAGKFCESGDILAKDVQLPELEASDLLVVYATGAYNYSMSSNYNRYRKPAMVFVEKGSSNLVLKRETLHDIVRNDLKLEEEA